MTNARTAISGKGMRYFFDVVMGSQDVKGPEGCESASLDEARQEAEQIARDLAAEDLQRGGFVGEDWRVSATDARGSVYFTVSFGAAILKRYRSVGIRDARKRFQERRDYACALFEETRGIAANVVANFEEIRAGVAQLT
jgi:hypothetical protein